MIFITNKEKCNKIKLEKDNYYIVSDFDQTITSGKSIGTWGININRSENFIKERDKLYNKYRPIEIDNNISKDEKFKAMKEWYEKSLNLLLEYKLEEKELIENVTSNRFKLRNGAIEFLNKMNKDNVPVLILSAGIGNVINMVLEHNNILFENIYLDSNILKFENGIAKGISNNVIHTMNKNSKALIQKFGDKIEGRKNIVLFGDILSDINMVSKDDLARTITVGFLDSKIDENIEFYKNNFDIVCTEDTSFIDVMEILFR
ncbi:MAG: hypothetical protein HFJ45_04005 [Clostridia bacterium]|nr:hypothetical protein [Clostridia bacterium]